MLTTIPRKNKIILSDYPYRRDIENRLFMADLSSFEVHVLQEILHGSLKISLNELKENLESSPEKIDPFIDKLSKTGLLVRKDNHIFIDKEMRKYYEFQIEKFDENFKPNVEYLQALLSKVSISSLPNWYSISRTADNIFESIIDKYLLTPKIYQKYLDELVFDEAILHKMADEVFKSEDLKVFSSSLREKYSLSRERFEECMLHMEFNFVCCLSYAKVDEVWREVVTPFHEWREYLLAMKESIPQAITEESKIIRYHSEDFGFLNDLALLVHYLEKANLIVWEGKQVEEKNSSFLSTLRDKKRAEICDQTPSYFNDLMHAMKLLGIAQFHEKKVTLANSYQEFLSHSIHDQAMLLYRQTLHELIKNHAKEFHAVEKNIRDTEKSLKRILNLGWVYYEDFIKGFIAPIGKAEKVALRKVGKRWKYVLPNYGESEKKLIQKTIIKRLFEVGMIAHGIHEEKICFKLTPFGKIALGD